MQIEVDEKSSIDSDTGKKTNSPKIRPSCSIQSRYIYKPSSSPSLNPKSPHSTNQAITNPEPASAESS